MSPVNKLLCVLIVMSSVMAILETEDTITQQAPRLFAATEMLFSVVFGIEYLARLWVAGIDPRYGGVLGYDLQDSAHRPGTVTTSTLGYHLHCRGGIVRLSR